MSVRIVNITIDTNDLAKAAAFWQPATGYEVSSSDEGTVYLQSLDEAGPGLALQLVPEPRSGKNRLHLDLGTKDLEGEVARLTALGASEVQRFDDGGWAVLTDTDGNQFCVVAA